MERTFANATLFSATVVMVYMMMSPPLHLSAQNELVIDEKVKVHKVTIHDVDTAKGELSVMIDEVVIPLVINASTTVFLGNGNETEIGSLSSGTNVYVFGSYDKASHSMSADKIVIRNKRITERTEPSRAQLSKGALRETDSKTPSFEMLGLSTKGN